MEIEFRNARDYYQDYMKFLTTAKYRHYQYSVLEIILLKIADYVILLC